MAEELEFAEAGEDFTGIRINPKDCVGHLLLIWVIEYMPHKPTMYSRPDKPSDVIVVDCVDLDVLDPDTEQQGLLARHTWWRQAKLIQKLKPLVGSPHPLLAVMGKGGASQGFNAPFVLNDAKSDPGARQRAQEWAARNPGFKPSTPFEGDVPEVYGPAAGEMTPQDRVERQPTMLERLAQSAQSAASRLPEPPQGKIPF